MDWPTADFIGNVLNLEEQYIQKCWQSIMFTTLLSPVTRGHGTQTLYRRRATQRDRAKVCQCSVRKIFVCKPFRPGQAQDAKSVLQVETSGRSGNCCEICGILGCYGFVLRWLKIWWKRGGLVEDILGGTICIVFKYFVSLPLLWVRMFSNTPGNDRFRVRFHCVARRISLAIRGIFLTQTIFTKKLLFPHGPHYNVWMCWLRCLIKKIAYVQKHCRTYSHIELWSYEVKANRWHAEDAMVFATWTCSPKVVRMVGSFAKKNQI